MSSSKNIRNSSGFQSINFTAAAGATGQIGPTGATGSPGSMAYAVQNNIAMQYDPASQLFANPNNSQISCEKIGNLVYIKITGFYEFPVGQTQIVSTTGCVPVGFRPTSDQVAIVMVINGFVDGINYLQRTDGWNTFFGICKLSTNGTLSFAPERGPAFGPVAIDGLSLGNFQGPRVCGLISQTICFRLI